jgi:hypothetical protein
MTTPGRAKRSRQNDVEPSAKSIHVVFAAGSPHERAARPEDVGTPSTARHVTATTTKALHTGIRGTRKL